MSKWIIEPKPIDRDRDRDWDREVDADAQRREAMARRLEQLAWLMDRAFHIPGTRIKVGLDALIGLLPIGGDVLTGLVQAGLVLVAMRHYNLPRSVATRMAANVLIDILVGAIPVLGDLFDVGFKANTRNVRLLQPYGHPSGLEVPPQKTPWRFILPIGAVLLLVLTLVLIGFITVVRWLFQF